MDTMAKANWDRLLLNRFISLMQTFYWLEFFNINFSASPITFHHGYRLNKPINQQLLWSTEKWFHSFGKLITKTLSCQGKNAYGYDRSTFRRYFKQLIKSLLTTTLNNTNWRYLTIYQQQHSNFLETRNF